MAKRTKAQRSASAKKAARTKESSKEIKRLQKKAARTRKRRR